MSIAYLNGAFVPLEEARISPLDRGYLLADGVYEVIPVYAGRLFRVEEHLQRLDNSLAAVRIRRPHTALQWQAMLQELVERNGGGAQSVYLHVTRGIAPRDHAFPADVEPSVFLMTRTMEREVAIRSARAITRPDIRWSRCDIKSIALIANVLLRQEAIDAGAAETLLVRDGLVTEGAASNVFVVQAGRVKTPPKGPQLLPGITRDLVVELAAEAGMQMTEADVTVDELWAAEEIWVTSSSMEITPVIELDGRQVGDGEPGPVWQRACDAFRRFKSRLMDGDV